MSNPELNCVCVIQARRGSSRLPDKILMPLAGKAVLARVIERCFAIEGVDKVVCAIPDDDHNEPVAHLAAKAGAEVSRGSEDDVLSRYAGAVEGLNTKYVMRVTADCPLLDPEVCADLLKAVADKRLPYGVTGGWPHGLDCEVFEKELLDRAHKEAVHPNDREHVTLWMKRKTKAEQFIYSPDTHYTDRYRWVLDYPEDYEMLKSLFDSLPPELDDMSWRSVLKHVESIPELKAINSHCIEIWTKKNQKIYEEAAE